MDIKPLELPYDVVINKPSDVIDLVINGLNTKSKDEHFKFDMYDFGTFKRDTEESKYTCFGCLATATLHTIYQPIVNEYVEKYGEHINYTNANCNIINKEHKPLYIVDYKELSIEWHNLHSLESAIDGLRRGNVQPLFLLFDIEKSVINDFIEEHDDDGTGSCLMVNFAYFQKVNSVINNNEIAFVNDENLPMLINGFKDLKDKIINYNL